MNYRLLLIEKNLVYLYTLFRRENMLEEERNVEGRGVYIYIKIIYLKKKKLLTDAGRGG
jgi:hypothetical protein